MIYRGIIKLLFHKLLLDEEHFDFANSRGIAFFTPIKLLASPIEE
jgi:hypothetical protein